MLSTLNLSTHKTSANKKKTIQKLHTDKCKRIHFPPGSSGKKVPTRKRMVSSEIGPSFLLVRFFCITRSSCQSEWFRGCFFILSVDTNEDVLCHRGSHIRRRSVIDPDSFFVCSKLNVQAGTCLRKSSDTVATCSLAGMIYPPGLSGKDFVIIWMTRWKFDSKKLGGKVVFQFDFFLYYVVQMADIQNGQTSPLHDLENP